MKQVKKGKQSFPCLKTHTIEFLYVLMKVSLQSTWGGLHMCDAGLEGRQAAYCGASKQPPSQYVPA